MLVLSMNSGGQLAISDCYPTASKTKSCYFIKKEPISPPKDDPAFKENWIYGDLSHQPLETLVTFIEDVCRNS
jgi:hypothetical protein